MTCMPKIERDLDTLITTHGLRAVFLVQEMKNKHGTRCLPTLLALLGDGDWSAHSLFSKFKLTSLIRASFQLRKDNIVIDDDFLKRLEHEAFWKLNRKQLYRVSDELLFLFPDRFDHITRWMEQDL